MTEILRRGPDGPYPFADDPTRAPADAPFLVPGAQALLMKWGIDEDFARRVAWAVLHVKYGPPDELRQGMREILLVVSPDNPVFVQFCADRVSSIFAEWPEFQVALMKRGLVLSNKTHAQYMVGTILRCAGACLGELVANVAGEVLGDPIRGLDLFDELSTEVWGRHPDFWRDARRLTHGAVCAQSDGSRVLEAIDRELGGGIRSTLLAQDAGTRGDQATRDAFGDALARLWERIDGKPSSVGLGPTMRARIAQGRNAARVEASARRWKRSAPHRGDVEDRQARHRARPAARLSSAVQPFGALDVRADPARAVEDSDAQRRFLEDLDEREREVLELRADGASYAEMGRVLGISDVAARNRARRLDAKIERFKKLHGA